MKKLVGTLSTLMMFAIGFAASGESETKSESIRTQNELREIPSECPRFTASEMISILEINAIQAQEHFLKEWLEISGFLGDMDSDGKYFTLDTKPSEFRLTDIHCSIPNYRREIIIQKIIQMKKGDPIIVKGKVTDMGEIMGYKVTIVDVYKGN